MSNYEIKWNKSFQTFIRDKEYFNSLSLRITSQLKYRYLYQKIEYKTRLSQNIYNPEQEMALF